MKLLFITTYNITISEEHFFTIGVLDGLIHSTAINVNLFSILLSQTDNVPALKESVYKGVPNYILYLPVSFQFQPSLIIEAIKEVYKTLSPQIIHSNMVEGFEIEAASQLRIPIVLTVHIGGFLCPRGGGHGFLYYDDRICPTIVNHKECLRCCCYDLPGGKVLYHFLKLIPIKWRLKLYNYIKDKRFVFYLTPALLITEIIENKINLIPIFQKASTIIAANFRLKEILEKNTIKNTTLIPHGIKDREKLPLPSFIEHKIKFYYLGRVQYGKGLHVLLNALKLLPKNIYEFHIIGDPEGSKKNQYYYRKLQREATNLSVFFHGRVPNSEIKSFIKDFHVMIHPAICLEVFGIAIAESIALGRPVLATRCGGPEIQVENNINGWLVKPNNSKDLENKILHIINNREEIIRLSNNCIKPPFNKYIDSLQYLYKTQRIES